MSQSWGGKDSTVGRAQNLAFACDGGNDRREGAATGAWGAGLPAAAVANSIADQRHGTIEETGPDEIAIFAGGNWLILLIENFEIPVLWREMHLPALALLNQSAIFRHAVAIEYARLKGLLDFCSDRRIERLAGGEDDVHGDSLTTKQREISEEAEDGGKTLEDFSLMFAKEGEVGRRSGFGKMEDAQQNLSFGEIVSPKRRVAALCWNDASAEESETRMAWLDAGPGPLSKEKRPIVAGQLLGVGDAEICASSSRGARSDTAMRSNAGGEQAVLIFPDSLTRENG